MNAQPHSHNISISDHKNYWIVQYGDQQKMVDKPIFRNPTKVLDCAVKKIIKKHDDASRQAGANEAEIITVLSQFKKTSAQSRFDVDKYTLPEENKWGSEQLSK